MKNSLILILLILTFKTQAQNTYTILKAEPKDGIRANGKVVKIGEKIKANAQIALPNSSAFLRVFNGRESTTVKNSGLLSANISKPRSMSNTVVAATKAVIANKADLTALLRTKSLLIIDSMHIPIPAALYVLPVFEGEPEGNFFFITYQYQGENVNKLLRNAENNSFVLDEDIFSIVGNKINPEEAQDIELRYAHNAESDEKIAQNLSLVFLHTTEIKEEIQAFISTSTEQDQEKLLTEILRYLHQYYGKPERAHLRNWLRVNFEGRF
jgi:hypothetical protein